MKNKLLIVDDQADIRQLLAGILEDEGYNAIAVSSGEEALSAIEMHRPHTVLLDVWLANPRFDGMYFLDIIKRNHKHLPVIMISGHGTIETAVNSLKKGAYDFIEKPFKTDVLLNVVQRSCELFRLRTELSQAREEEEGHQLVGISSTITTLRQSVMRAAKTNSRILLQGPTGIGKQSLARFIHTQSPRQSAPFTVVRCEKGQNTSFQAQLSGTSTMGGALDTNIEGTIYFDAVDHLNPQDQGYLLNLLRGQQIESRIICGTTQDLAVLVKAGTFLEDLFFRINVVALNIPALKDRCEDIPTIFQEIMKLEAHAFGGEPKELSSDALVVLQAYSWPGNIRQMRNMIESLYIHHPHAPMVTIPMLPEFFHLDRQERVAQAFDKERILSAPLKDAREQFEKAYLALHFARFNGNISKMSRAVGMDRTALHRKIKQLNLQFEALDEASS